VTAFSMCPVHPAGRRNPATAVAIRGDETTARQALLEIARIFTVEDFAALKHHAERLFLSDELEEHEVDAELAGFDEVVADACAADGTAITDVFRVRVGVEEVRDFEHALEVALDPQVTGIGVPA
jgi:hypothetical protein